MTEEEKENIVLDLVNLTPRRASDIDASTETNTGYTHKELFDLGLHSRYAVDIFVYKIFYSSSDTYQSWHTATRLKGQKLGVQKRRVSRVWSRIEPSVKKMWREGAKGIYGVSHGRFGASNKLGHIYAKDKPEALEIAKLCFSYLIDSENNEDGTLYVHFVSTAGPESIPEFNKTIVKSLKDQRQNIENIVKDSKQTIEKIEHILSALKISESIMKKV